MDPSRPSANRAELERKRVMLAQMREARRLRMNQEDQNAIKKERLEDADSILLALGLSASLSRVSTAPSDVPSMVDTKPSPGLSQQSSQPQSSEPSSTFVPQPTIKPTAPLQVVQAIQVNIPPKERVYYTKSTQTSTLVGPAHQLALEWDDEFPCTPFQDEEDEQSISTGAGLPRVEMVIPTTNGQVDEHEQGLEAKTEIREMNEDERKQIELREDYQQFIDRATKVMERALYQNESPEIFIQYFPSGSNGALDSDRKSGNKLSLNRMFFDENWSKNRCVTGFDWSAQYPELLLASYYTNEQAPSDPDGTLLVWNMKFKNTSPEYVFHCQSPIMSCCFAKFHPSLIVGGTYSGQIVLWDMRSNKKTPVQRSPLTATAHTHPVYCAKVVGTQNAHNLISISTDGKLCSWSLDMLSAPQETMDLQYQEKQQKRSVAVTCMSYHPDDYNNFLVGTEEGAVYSACRHGSKTGIMSAFQGHQGLVTSVDYRPIYTQAGYSHLFLTSSIDWTVKLWDSKESEPIHSFESNGDYVYDVKWSPNSPALFATADGDGRVDIWNLANDSELPTASTHIEPVSSGDTKVQPSLNKLIWTPSGNQIVAGDDVGRIHVFDIGDVGEIAPSRGQEDKWKLGDMSRVKI